MVVIGLVAIVVILLQWFGVILAIEPAISGLLRIGSLFSNPWILSGTIVALVFLAGWVWYFVDNFWMRTIAFYGTWKTRLTGHSERTVRGFLEHGDVHWTASYTAERTVVDIDQLCPFCHMKLIPRTMPRREVRRPNTAVTADERTHETTISVRENVFGREKNAATDLINSLSCPRESCSFAIQGEQHVSTERTAVENQFLTHIDRMRGGGIDPYKRWREDARERVPEHIEPTPSDLWDAYARTCDDDTVTTTRRFGAGLPGETSEVSCRALVRHRNDADGIEQLIEHAPEGFDRILATLFRSTYIDERRAIVESMNEEGERCRSSLQQLEAEYGSTIERMLSRLSDRTQPRCDLQRVRGELGEATGDLTSLYDDLEMKYLPNDKRNWLERTNHGLKDAVTYVDQLLVFSEYEHALSDRIEEFESRFLPYEHGQTYMTSPDEAFLTDECGEIRYQLRELRREIDLEVLPEDDEQWVRETIATYNAYTDVLVDYNEKFVARELERFADLFDTEDGSLNDAQQKAIVRNDRHNLVDASAGTGKTLTLTHRFLYLHRKGVPLDDIVAVTYTNDAAEEMKDRITNALDVESEDQLNVFTYHKFAIDVVGSAFNSVDFDLKNAHKSFVQRAMSNDPALVNRYEDALSKFHEHHRRFKMVGTEYIDACRGEKTRREFCIEKYKKFLDNARNFSLSPGEIRSRLIDDDPEQHAFCTAGSWLLQAFLDHADNTDGPVDFADILHSAIEMGRADPDRFESMFEHILLDEFQDADAMVIEFIQQFLGEMSDTRLFAVGDDWQSIYGFRGSDPTFFIDFEERFSGVTKTQLEINYRCPPDIVQAGAELMQYSKDPQTQKTVRTHADEGIQPTIHPLSGIYENRAAAYATRLVERALAESDTEPDDVMILSRNDQASPFVDRIRTRLDDQSIPHDGMADEDESTVTVQSIHASKGTEAEHVILINAREKTPHGLPMQRRKSKLLAPIIDNKSTHFGEERRLFYVAMTRAKRKLHIVTEHGNVSRYVDDIDHYCKVERSDVWELTGELVRWINLDQNLSKPFEADFRCNGYTVEFKTWRTRFLRDLIPGKRYHLSNIDPRDDGYGQQITIDESVEIKPLDTEESSTAES
ncbi:UvrD-helicase domain-containing protein [Halocatena marina]|uniref:UvrD-helicase domain-containing protein n=1 Tax=Halocatena marina TaxID=2934937 RepID=UPI0022240E87|nr:UvrD-helicase domain-containing protein [Halocatena marina]